MSRKPQTDPVRRVLKKNVSTIHINARLTLTQRKLVNALLYNAYEELLSEDTHSIPVSLLSEMIGFDSRNQAHLRQAIRGLTETSVEWDKLDLASSQAASGKIKSSKAGFLKAAVEQDYHNEGAAKKKALEAAQERKAVREKLERELEALKTAQRDAETAYRWSTAEIIEEASGDLRCAASVRHSGCEGEEPRDLMQRYGISKSSFHRLRSGYDQKKQ